MKNWTRKLPALFLLISTTSIADWIPALDFSSEGIGRGILADGSMAPSRCVFGQRDLLRVTPRVQFHAFLKHEDTDMFSFNVMVSIITQSRQLNPMGFIEDELFQREAQPEAFRSRCGNQLIDQFDEGLYQMLSSTFHTAGHALPPTFHRVFEADPASVRSFASFIAQKNAEFDSRYVAYGTQPKWSQMVNISERYMHASRAILQSDGSDTESSGSPKANRFSKIKQSFRNFINKKTTPPRNSHTEFLTPIQELVAEFHAYSQAILDELNRKTLEPRPIMARLVPMPAELPAVLRRLDPEKLQLSAKALSIHRSLQERFPIEWFEEVSNKPLLHGAFYPVAYHQINLGARQRKIPLYDALSEVLCVSLSGQSLEQALEQGVTTLHSVSELRYTDALESLANRGLMSLRSKTRMTKSLMSALETNPILRSDQTGAFIGKSQAEAIVEQVEQGQDSLALRALRALVRSQNLAQ